MDQYQIIPTQAQLPTSGGTDRQIKRQMNRQRLQVESARLAMLALHGIHLDAQYTALSALDEVEQMRQQSGRTPTALEQAVAGNLTATLFNDLTQVAAQAGQQVLQVHASAPLQFDDRSGREQFLDAFGEGLEIGTRWLPGGR
jgi:hypothetical protein